MNLLTMRWADVDLDNGVWRIPDTKNDTAKTILLTGPELEILKNRFANRKSFEFVFPGRKSPHLYDPRKGWKRILKRAQIENLHLHDLMMADARLLYGYDWSKFVRDRQRSQSYKDVSTTRKSMRIPR